jgi:exodeoxyribonuclease-3
MRIATWNVNSLRARLENVETWLRAETPDVLLMQETKVVDEDFPLEPLTRLGYEVAFAGQKTYNGVAILARHPLEDVRVGLSGDGREADKRFISATVGGRRVMSAYIPNGKSLDSPSYPEKLEFLTSLRGVVRTHLEKGESVILGGDFNVCHDERDVFDVNAMKDQLHFTMAERSAIDAILSEGLTDAFRHFEKAGNHYSWWDYRMGAFRRNRGLRIDYLFVSSDALAKLVRCRIDRNTRSWEKPSDHAPVVLELEDG